ncbi:hypothetical protein D3C72_2110400 [compost metagenome]
MAQQHDTRSATNPLRGKEAGNAPHGSLEILNAQAQIALHDEWTVSPAARVDQELDQRHRTMCIDQC